MVKVIALSGPVAAGKSTLLQALYNRLSDTYRVYIIREYIDVLPDANDKLTDYLNGKISAYDFQNYILDYYEHSSWLINDYDYVLVERCPVEGLMFFAKLDVNKGRMSLDEYLTLIMRAKCMTFYPDPSTGVSEPTSKNRLTIHTDDKTPDEITDIVYGHIDTIDIVQLKVKPETIKHRIIQRGRECEIDAYSDDYLKYMCKHYY